MSASRSPSPQRGRHPGMSASRSCGPQRDRPMSESGSSGCSPQQDEAMSESGSHSPQQEDQDVRDASPSRSPSRPDIGRKRSYSPSEDDGLHQLVKAQKVSERGGRPKASDYDDVAKEVILCATAIYRCLVSTSNAFPTPSEEGEMIRDAWNCANAETSQEVPIALTPVIAKVVRVILYYWKKSLVSFLFRFQHVVVKSGAKSNPVL